MPELAPARSMLLGEAIRVNVLRGFVEVSRNAAHIMHAIRADYICSVQPPDGHNHCTAQFLFVLPSFSAVRLASVQENYCPPPTSCVSGTLQSSSDHGSTHLYLKYRTTQLMRRRCASTKKCLSGGLGPWTSTGLLQAPTFCVRETCTVLKPFRSVRTYSGTTKA